MGHAKSIEPMTDSGWLHAACRGEDPELWHPEGNTMDSRAIAICNRCPIQQRCYDFAKENRMSGIWGGRRFKVVVGRSLNPFLEEHGTLQAYGKHVRNKEEPCEKCKHVYNFEIQYQAQREREMA